MVNETISVLEGRNVLHYSFEIKVAINLEVGEFYYFTGVTRIGCNLVKVKEYQLDFDSKIKIDKINPFQVAKAYSVCLIMIVYRSKSLDREKDISI